MPLNPSKSLHFDSWEQLLRWLPEANENQLLTVFVWAGEQVAPAGEARRLAQVRKEAFEHLVRRTRDRLARFLIQRVHVRDPHLVEDIVQQVLIKIYLRGVQFDPKRSFWGWVYQIARNVYIDTLRRTHPGDVAVGQTGGNAEDELEHWLENVAPAIATPESAMVEKEERQQLESAIAGLPALQRTIVQLKREGVKGKEIAQRLGISQAYVSQLFHEAGDVLRDALER